jgi:spermidine synthase
VPSFGATWGFVVGSLEPDPTALSTEEVDRRIAERIAGKLRYFDVTTRDGMFSVPKYLRDAVADEQRVITRSDPLFVT